MLRYSEDRMILSLFIWVQYQRQTDRRTDGFAVAITCLALGLCADARKNMWYTFSNFHRSSSFVLSKSPLSLMVYAVCSNLACDRHTRLLLDQLFVFWETCVTSAIYRRAWVYSVGPLLGPTALREVGSCTWRWSHVERYRQRRKTPRRRLRHRGPWTTSSCLKRRPPLSCLKSSPNPLCWTTLSRLSCLKSSSPRRHLWRCPAKLWRSSPRPLRLSHLRHITRQTPH